VSKIRPNATEAEKIPVVDSFYRLPLSEFDWYVPLNGTVPKKKSPPEHNSVEKQRCGA